jgi:hypothetical protein
MMRSQAGCLHDLGQAESTGNNPVETRSGRLRTMELLYIVVVLAVAYVVLYVAARIRRGRR